MTWTAMPRTCWICDAPIPDRQYVCLAQQGVMGEIERHTDRACAEAWNNQDSATLKQRQAAACAAGHHCYPGAWSADPADPYGDARLWECTKGCGHVQRHPGYGMGRFLAEHGIGAAPVVTADALFDLAAAL